MFVESNLMNYKTTVFGEIFRMITQDLAAPLRFYHSKCILKKGYILWISCFNGVNKFTKVDVEDSRYIVSNQERFTILKASANLKYIKQKITEWEYNVNKKTNVLAAEFPPVIWHYFMKKHNERNSYYFSLAQKYASKKHKEPAHIDAKFYKFFTAYYSQKLLIEGF